jgi:hypothetical protein
MSGGTRTFTERIIGASRLDVRIYDEVEHDNDATVQAAGVVVLVAAAAALGGADRNAAVIITAIAVSIIGWLLWAGITYLIGDKLLGGTATWGELLRTLGFAQAPGMLLMLVALPAIGWAVQLVVGLWMLVAAVLALRQALDFGTGRAIATALLGLLPYVALRVLVL